MAYYCPESRFVDNIQPPEVSLQWKVWLKTSCGLLKHIWRNWKLHWNWKPSLLRLPTNYHSLNLLPIICSSTCKPGLSLRLHACQRMINRRSVGHLGHCVTNDSGAIGSSYARHSPSFECLFHDVKSQPPLESIWGRVAAETRSSVKRLCQLMTRGYRNESVLQILRTEFRIHTESETDRHMTSKR